MTLPNVSLDQSSQMPITLWEFLPDSLSKFSSPLNSCNTTNAEESAEDEERHASSSKYIPVEVGAQICTENCTACMAAITFSDEDLLLGSTPHNRPLFACG